MVACLAYSLTLQMETIRFSETSTNFYRNSLRYIPEHISLDKYGYRNLRLNKDRDSSGIYPHCFVEVISKTITYILQTFAWRGTEHSLWVHTATQHRCPWKYTVTCRDYAWLITGCGSDVWIYNHSYHKYTSNYNHLQQPTVVDCLKLVPFPSWTPGVFSSTVAGYLISLLLSNSSPVRIGSCLIRI
jgi:hypothetical protein